MIFVVVIAVIIASEAWIKHYVESHFDEHTSKKALGGKILLTRYHNRGAFLEFGSSKRQIVKWVSVLLTLCATILFVVTLGHAGKNLLKAGLSLLIGGAFSNSYDRIKRGYVVDYFRFNVKWEALRRVIFNLSDFCILIGAMISALSSEGLK